jgi:hypothetical protein
MRIVLDVSTVKFEITACFGTTVRNGTSPASVGQFSFSETGRRMPKNLKVKTILLLCPRNYIFRFPSCKMVNTEFYTEIYFS